MIIDAEKSLLKQFSCGNINDQIESSNARQEQAFDMVFSTHTSKQLIEGKPILSN